MSPSLPATWRAGLDELADLSHTQTCLRLLVALSPQLVLALAHAAGATWSTPVAALVLALSLGAAVEPDSHLALVVLAVLGWFWLTRVPLTGSVWSLLAGVAVLLFHSAGALSATAPPAATPPAALLTRWLRWTAAVAAATAAVWGLVLLALGANPPGRPALTAAALGAVALGALLLRRTDRLAPARPARRRAPIEPGPPR